MKEKFELEFLFKTSPRVLENMISTPSGLAEWFADDVNHEDDLFSFEWDGNIEQANLLFNKNNSKVLEFVKTQDQRRNISISSYFPEFYSLYQ